MNYKIALSIFAVSLILVTSVFVLAQPLERVAATVIPAGQEVEVPSVVVDSAPFSAPTIVFSDSGIIKGLVDVRHEFPGIFTANLNPVEIALLNSLGIETQPVLLYQPLAKPEKCSPWPECKNGDDEEPPARNTPSDQTPWGIERVYNDSTITSTSGGTGVDVAVLDTGVDINHPDLSSRIEQCKDFTKGKRIQNKCADKFGHGTHVSGTIAADSGADGLGIFGVAPGVDIFAYKVCGDIGCFTDDISAAIDYAGSHGAEIVSISLGGDSESRLIRDAIVRNPSLLFVAAAGNDGSNLNTLDFPGANANVIAVGATDVNDRVADFSSRGSNTNGADGIQTGEIEVAAPGVDVESTCTGSFDGASFDKDGTVNGYCIISGTSMATPHVSGLAAKHWQGNAADTRVFLQTRASLTDITSGLHATTGYDPASGFGLPTVG